MNQILTDILLFLACLLAVQLNVMVGTWLVQFYRAKRHTDRFVKVQSLADLAALDTYQPQDPPDIPLGWSMGGMLDETGERE